MKVQRDVIEEASIDMDENRVLEKYIDKVDKDRRDQEERMEKRFNLTMEAINSTHIKIEKLQDKLDEKNR